MIGRIVNKLLGRHNNNIKVLGENATIGGGSKLDYASIAAANPSGCKLDVGSSSNVECTIAFEQPNVSVKIGSRTHVGGKTLLDAACGIEIGDDVLIAFDTLIIDHDSHSLSFNERKNDVAEWMEGRKDWSKVKMAPISIRSKAWIGTRAIILKGVTIGEGAVVGAGSVVTKDVPEWTVVAGNPAKIIRELTDEERGS